LPRKEKMRSVFSQCLFAASLYRHGSPPMFYFYLGAMAANALMPALTLAAFRRSIDLIYQGLESRAWLFLGGYLLLQFLGHALSGFQSYASSCLQDRAGLRATNLLLDSVEEARTLEMYETPAYHDSIFVLRGLDFWITQGATGLIWAMYQAIGLISVGILLWSVNPWILLPMTVTVIPASLFQRAVATLYYGGIVGRAPESRKLEYIRSVLFDPAAAAEIRLYGVIPKLLERYEKLFRNLMERELAVTKKEVRTSLFLSVVSWSGMVAGIFLGIWNLLAGRGTIGDLAILFGATRSFNYNLSTMVDWLGTYQKLSLNLDRYKELVELARKYQYADGTQEFSGPIGGIRVSNLSFSYPGSSKEVLQGVNLTLRPGETVALLGPNGAGKTTLARLMLGLYRPTGGNILISKGGSFCDQVTALKLDSDKPDQSDQRDQDISRYRLEEVQKRMTSVFQDFARYLLTFRENVGFGDISKINDDAAIWGALEEADAKDLVPPEPQGLDTPLGKEFGGIELSGGEWQKLAVARSILREYDFIVLDEPSASLDAEAEYSLYLRFKEMVKGKICLLISHRFTTVRMADRIVVLDQGKVIEEGDHAELMDRDGFYARMYRMQAERYKDEPVASEAMR